MRYDVIIVGGGPAGATLGREACKAGLKTIILDKKPFPRYKPCGGAISNRTAALLNIDINEAIEDTVDTVLITYKYKEPILYKAPVSFASMVMRDKFDTLLIEKAMEEGCEFMPSCNVIDISIDDDGLQIKTEKDDICGKVLVGADGVNGSVSKLTGLYWKRRLAVALESEIPIDPNTLEEERGRVHVDYGNVPRGYGWVFPKKDHVSVGIGTFTQGVKNLKELFFLFLEKKGLNVNSASLQVYGHPIPIPDWKRPLTSDRVILIGDAAGLADPFSGEGILYAVKSAQIALSSILEGFNKGDFKFASYQELIKEEIMTELKTAKAISNIFYLAPRLFHKAFKRDVRILDNFFQIVAGNHTYDKLHTYLTSNEEFAK